MEQKTQNSQEMFQKISEVQKLVSGLDSSLLDAIDSSKISGAKVLPTKKSGLEITRENGGESIEILEWRVVPIRKKKTIKTAK